MNKLIDSVVESVFRQNTKTRQRDAEARKKVSDLLTINKSLINVISEYNVTDKDENALMHSLLSKMKDNTAEIEKVLNGTIE